MTQGYSADFISYIGNRKPSVPVDDIGAAVSTMVLTDETQHFGGQSQEKSHLEIGDIVAFTYVSKEIMATVKKYKKLEAIPKRIVESNIYTLNPIVIFAGWENGLLHGVNLRLIDLMKDVQTYTNLMREYRKRYYVNVDGEERLRMSVHSTINLTEEGVGLLPTRPKWSSSNAFIYENFPKAYGVAAKRLPYYYRKYKRLSIHKPTIININEAEMMLGGTAVTSFGRFLE